MKPIFQNAEYSFRFLDKQHYSQDLFTLLGQLTKAPLPSAENFNAYFQAMQDQHCKHINIIGKQIKSGKCIAFGSIIITDTVLWGRVGKIENIVTCKSVRGKGMGKVVIQILKDQGWKNKCNKISLFCEQKNIRFYEKLGFKLEGQIYACYKK